MDYAILQAWSPVKSRDREQSVTEIKMTHVKKKKSQKVNNVTTDSGFTRNSISVVVETRKVIKTQGAKFYFYFKRLWDSKKELWRQE